MWVCFLILYTLSSNPIKKGDGLNETEVIDTISVQLLATLAYHDKNPKLI